MVKTKEVKTAGHGSGSAKQGFVAEFTMTTEETTKLIESLKKRIEKYPTRQVRVVVREDQVFVG